MIYCGMVLCDKQPFRHKCLLQEETHMEHTIEKLSGNKVKLAFKVPAADFEQAIEKAYIKLRGQIAVPGFRKGKAPRKLIEKMYGTAIFYEDALDILLHIPLYHLCTFFQN